MQGMGQPGSRFPIAAKSLRAITTEANGQIDLNVRCPTWNNVGRTKCPVRSDSGPQARGQNNEKPRSFERGFRRK